jgi:hypothetical protein
MQDGVPGQPPSRRGGREVTPNSSSLKEARVTSFNELHRSDCCETSEIQSTGSTVKLLVVRNNEELDSAEQTHEVLADSAQQRST